MNQRLAFSLNEFKNKCVTKQQRLLFNKLIKAFDESETVNNAETKPTKITNKSLLDSFKDCKKVDEAIEVLKSLGESIDSVKSINGKPTKSTMNVIKGRKVSVNGNSYFKCLVIDEEYGKPSIAFRYLNSRTNDLSGFGGSIVFDRKYNQYIYTSSSDTKKIGLVGFKKLIVQIIK